MHNDDIRNALTDYEMLVADQRNRIVNIRVAIERESDPAEAIKQFSKINEEIYLKLKSLIHEIQVGSPDGIVEDLGTTESFPSSIELLDSGIWKFHLPPFYSVSAKKRLYNEGKHIYYLVQNLLKQYEKERGRITPLAHPLVAFRHHICTKSDNVFDFDNIDSKRATDAMQDYLLQDDNGLYLTVTHDMIRDEKESYCDIFVMDQDGRKGILDYYIDDNFGVLE